MPVIRPDDEITHPQSRAVKERERIAQAFPRLGLTQNATTVATIQLLVQLPSLLPFERATDTFRDSAVRRVEPLWIGLQPLGVQAMSLIPALSRVEPFFKHLGRNGIVLAKSDEVCHTRLPPVRQISNIDMQ